MLTFFLGKLLVLALILGAGSLLGSWGAQLSRVALTRTRLDPIARDLVVSVVRPSVIAVAAYAALTTLQVDLSPLLAVFGAAGIAIALALKDSLSAVAAGALLLSIRAYEGGDTIEVAGITGTVVEYDLFTVTLKAPDGALVAVPNEVLLKSPVKNLTRNGLRRLSVDVQLAHQAPLEAALADASAAVLALPAIVADPAPACVISELNLDGAVLTVTGWVKPSELGKTRSALLALLDQAVGAHRARRTPTQGDA